MTSNTFEIRPNDRLEHALLAAWSSEANFGMCAVDDIQRVVMLNQAACRMLGVNGLDMLNEPFAKLVAAFNFLPGIARWLATPGFSGEKHASCERDGVTIDLMFKTSTVELPLSAAPGDAVVGQAITSLARFKVIAITDVSALLSAQRHVTSETYRRQWQALNAGVVISDAQAPDMPIVYVNPMFEQMSGYSAAEVLGRNCRFLQGIDTRQSGLQAIREAIHSRSNGYAKLRNYRKDGSIFVNELFISPVKDGAGTVTHFVGIQHLETSPPVAASTIKESRASA